MHVEHGFDVLLPLHEAIDYTPLTVPLDTPLDVVISLLDQSRVTRCALSCGLADPPSLLPDDPLPPTQRSCVVVVEGQKPMGIFTERDIVWLTAADMDFHGMTIADVMAQPVITLPQAAFHDIFAALFLFRRYRIRHLPIVNEHGHLVGVVTSESIRQVLRPASLLRLRRVADVMTPEVIHAPPTASVLSLARLMTCHRVSSIVITESAPDDRFCPIGIITERDIVQFRAMEMNLATTQAGMVMSAPLFLLKPEDSLWTAHQAMQTHRIGRMVVVWENGRKMGILTQSSLLKALDPMELYTIIENLQTTLTLLQGQSNVTHSPALRTLALSSGGGEVPEATMSTELGRSPYRPSVRSLTPDLSSLLQTVQVCLRNLATEPEMTPAQRQSRANLALANLEQLVEQLSSLGLNGANLALRPEAKIRGQTLSQ